MLTIDIHTHTLSSGHGTTDTVTDLARTAYQKGMTLLGIADHGPATPGSCKESYFRSLMAAPRIRSGIRLLYGIEANILDENGNLDLSDTILSGLDFVIASIHPQTYQNPSCHCHSFGNRQKTIGNMEELRHSNTLAYIHAMSNPYVTIIGHPDDTHYPIDHEAFVKAASKYNVIMEVNEASLMAGSYRGRPEDTIANMTSLLMHCRKQNLPILLSSDSHGSAGVGQAPCAEALVAQLAYPRELILNHLPAEEFITCLHRLPGEP